MRRKLGNVRGRRDPLLKTIDAEVERGWNVLRQIAGRAFQQAGRSARVFVVVSSHYTGMDCGAHLARKTDHVIAQDLLWAFGCNAITFTAAFYSQRRPLLAAILMLLSSIFAMGNSPRLPKKEPPAPLSP